MINSSLSISSLVSVNSSLAPAAVQAQSTQTMLILGSSAVIDPVTRMESFPSATAVATLFGSDAPETAAAETWFDQTPQPLSVNIGRWVQTASSGQLIGAPLSAAQTAIAQWNAITDGGFTISINGAAQQVTALNFAESANMNGVAGVIQAAMTGATIVFNAVNQNFVITSDTTGAMSTVSFASAPTGDGVTNISAMLGLAATSSGAFVANGLVAESALAAVTLFDQMFGQQWYGLSVLGAADSDTQAIAPFLKASSNKHYLFTSTQEAGVLVPSFTTDIASVMQGLNLPGNAVQFSSSSAFSAISLAGKMLTVNYSASNSTIAAMWQQEPGITPENLNSTQLASVIAKNANVFAAYNNGSSIVIPGIGSNGTFIDAQIGADALALQIQTAVFNLMFTGAKVPQTDPGMHQIKVTIEGVLAQFVQNGYIATGLPWNSAGFGTLQQGQILPAGYYVFQPAVASQPAAQRAQRISVPFQIAANLAGAVGTVSVTITLQN